MFSYELPYPLSILEYVYNYKLLLQVAGFSLRLLTLPRK